jgi:hypothetical protein
MPALFLRYGFVAKRGYLHFGKTGGAIPEKEKALLEPPKRPCSPLRCIAD